MKKIILIALMACITQVNAQSTCQATFTYTQDSNGEATFTSTSSGTTTNTTYLWDFGDLSGTAGSSPNHTYGYNGTYLVSLTINDGTTGCNNKVTDSVFITTAAPCNIHASFSYSVGPNASVAFTNTSTGEGGFNTWTLNFGGDVAAFSGNGGNFGTTLGLIYNGHYVATLTVTGGGCTSIYSDTVVVTTSQLNCSLVSSYTDTLGNNGEASFYSTSTGVLSNMQSNWNFGDGTLPVKGNTYAHNYAFNGSYHVTLFVRDSFNICKDSIGKTITISNAPNTCTSTPSFSLSPNSSQAHSWFAVPDYSSQVINAVWFWGDSTSSTGLYPSHTYASAGNYNICVKVYLACGDSASYCQLDSLSRTSSTNQIIQISVVNNISGIKQLVNNKEQVSVYPNPTNGIFTIESSSLSLIQANGMFAQLYDINGKMVLSQSISDSSQGEGKITIDASSLNNGIYNLSLVSNHGIVNKRVVIVK